MGSKEFSINCQCWDPVKLICLDLMSLQPREDVLSGEWFTKQLLSSFIKELDTLWVPLIQVEVVVNA
jgi:hypothetical protein